MRTSPWRRLFVSVCVAFSPCCGGSGGDSPAVVVLASATIDGTGGTVAVTDPGSPILGSGVTIPPGALAAPTVITVSRVMQGNGLPSSVYDVEFGPAGTTFTAPVTVTLKYSQQYLTDFGLVESDLRIVQRDEDSFSSTLATSGQDTVNDLISAPTGHFSRFAAVAGTTATLFGTYFFSDYYFDSPGVPVSESGTLKFDGKGGVSFHATANSNGSIGSFSGSGTYAVSPDGAVTFASGGSTATGHVHLGGQMLTLANTSAGSPPEIIVAIRKGGKFSTASVSGTYVAVDYYFDGPGVPASETSVLTFDGTGGVTYAGNDNKNGTAGVFNGNTTYSVSGDGTFTFAGGDKGGVLAGGNVIVWANTTPGSPPEVIVAVKKGGTFSNASLSTDYVGVDYYFDSPGVPASEMYTLTFDGSGGVSYSGTDNKNGTVGAFSGNATYSVASDGTFTFGASSTGQLLAGGEVFVLSNTGAGSPPEVSLGFKR